MIKKNLPFLALVVLSLVSQTVNAQQYVFDKKIPVPGDGGYDYLAIDEVNRHLFVSHGTAFNVVDLATEKPIAVIDGLKGVHGIAIVNEVNKGFISDGKADAVVVIDLTTFKVITTIKLPATDEDAIIYDPYSKKVFVFNGAVKATYPLSPCGQPTGLAFDAASHRLFTGCRTNKGLSVVDAKDGKVITTLPIGAGVDAVVYDADDKLIFVSNGDATATIIRQESADKYSVVQTLATAPRARTMTMDKKTKKIYFSAPEFQPGTRNIIPGTFAVLVYKPQ